MRAVVGYLKWLSEHRVGAASGLAVGAILVSLGLLWGLSWNAPMYSSAPETLFSIGPLASGESVEQEFEVAGSFLTGVEFFARADGVVDSSTPFVARLREGETIVREGRIETGVGAEIEAIRWDFGVLADPEGRRFRLQVVVDEGATRSIYLMASLTDKLPGSAVTNGIPAAPHVDLALQPWRKIRRMDVLAATAGSLPAGFTGLTVLVLAVGLGMGYLIFAMARDPVGSGVVPWVGLGLSIAVLVLVVEAQRSAGLSLPERHFRLWPGFFRTVGLLTVAMIGTIAAGPARRVTGSVRKEFWDALDGRRERSLAALVLVAVLASLVAGLAYALDGPEIVFVEVAGSSGEQVVQGAVGLLGHEPARIMSRAAAVIWLVVGAAALLFRVSARQRGSG
ncbi:MAG: hypothetical protein QGG58_00490 [Chloroflexota bacterium]|jgi:hypothetical protein|nr:hypothetical protein [Chloroflexota bacterium]